MSLYKKIIESIKIGLTQSLSDDISLNEEKIMTYNNGYKIHIYYPKDSTIDHEYVKNNKRFLYDFFNNGYKAKGYNKFDGCFNEMSLLKNAACIKVAKDLNKNVIALTAYSNYMDGYKCVGATITTNPELQDIGKQALISIIKQDILNWKNYWWCECSDAIQHYYDKFGAIKIPAKYAQVFGFKNINIIDDYTYERKIGENQEIVNKTIYGFNSKETFDKIVATEQNILKAINEYENDIKNLQEDYTIDEAFNTDNSELQILQKYRMIINVFFEAKCQGYNEFTKELLEKLKNSIKYVEDVYNNKKYPINLEQNIMLAIENGKDILNSSTELKLNKLN